MAGVQYVLDFLLNNDSLKTYISKCREHFCFNSGKFEDPKTNVECSDRGEFLKDINKTFGSGWTRLHLSVMNEDLEICKFLLNHGANVNAETDLGNSALHFVADRGNIELTKIILAYSSNPYHTNKKNETPIQIANKRGHIQIAVICVRFSDFEFCRSSTHLGTVYILGQTLGCNTLGPKHIWSPDIWSRTTALVPNLFVPLDKRSPTNSVPMENWSQKIQSPWTKGL